MIIRTSVDLYVNTALFDYIEGVFSSTANTYKLVAVKLNATPVLIDLTPAVPADQFKFYEQSYIQAVLVGLQFLDFSQQ